MISPYVKTFSKSKDEKPKIKNIMELGRDPSFQIPIVVYEKNHISNGNQTVRINELKISNKYPKRIQVSD